MQLAFRTRLNDLLKLTGFLGPDRNDAGRHDEYVRQRARRFYTIAALIHFLVILPELVQVEACLHETPMGIPGGKGDKLPKGKVKIQVARTIRRKRKVRQSPVSIFEQIQDEDLKAESETRQAFSDTMGVPGGIGSGAAAAGSPKGTVLGGTLYFYRIKFDGPNWNANHAGVGPLMNEVKDAGVVKKISGQHNPVSLKDLPKHSGKFLPAVIYMTGTGHIKANDEEVKNLRDYLHAGGMVFADVSGGDFYDHFVGFMKRVLPNVPKNVIEYDHEIYRGSVMPYAMIRGCPIYRAHQKSGPAEGWWIGPKIAVFLSRGDIGSAWGAAGLFKSRKRNVEEAFRMGVNIIAYGLLYFKYDESENQ